MDKPACPAFRGAKRQSGGRIAEDGLHLEILLEAEDTELAPVAGLLVAAEGEAAVETGAVSDRASLISWLKTVLIHGSGRIDGVLFREAHAATRAEDWARVKDIAEFGNAFQPTPEFALESRAQGAAWRWTGLCPGLRSRADCPRCCFLLPRLSRDDEEGACGQRRRSRQGHAPRKMLGDSLQEMYQASACKNIERKI